ncbi:MAG: tetratricopeptide repeat protein [Sandaracinus sp.]|nr:tetratricopeptide repeat protein [Sandaracinus sp.]
MRRIAPLWLVLVAALPLPAAHAQDDDPNRVFLRAAAAYGNGEYAEAADLFERAYALRPEPQLLRSLASARERAGRLAGAIEAYEAYLREAPDAEDRPDVERSLDTLRRQRALEEEIERRRDEPPPPTPVVPVVPAEAPPRPAGLRYAAFSIAGVGVLTLGIAAALGLTAESRYDEASQDDTSHRDTLRLEDEANTLGRSANALFGVGGALTLVGVVWAIVELVLGRSNDDESTSFGPGGWRWRFG